MKGGDVTTAAAACEAFLARLYVDAAALDRFLADPRAEAQRAGLADDQCRALAALDLEALELAARGFAVKRAGQRPDPSHPASWWRRLRAALGRP